MSSLSDDLSLIDELDPSSKDEFLEDLKRKISDLKSKVAKEKIKIFFTGRYDKNNAIISIYAGAGGLDAQDWVSMLSEMYFKYDQKKGFKVSVLHAHKGEEKGSYGNVTKNITFEVVGKYAYGFLKHEMGVHRLVRISPFSAQKLRHTSFAYVEVLPSIEDSKEIFLDDSELEIETFRSSGPGGQNVNKRDTAVRIRHIPTGIVVSCQSERNQSSNKEKAKRILYAKLIEEMEKQKAKEISELKGKKIEIEWGNQIRSYVMHPYQLVKDHRTKYETSNIKAVLEGEIDDFIESEILFFAKQKND